MTRLIVTLTVGATLVAGTLARAADTPLDTTCIVASGRAAARCLTQYTEAVEGCRDVADSACEALVRAPGGALAGILGETEAPVRRGCSPAAADALTFSLGLDDLVSRTAEACAKWAEDFLDVVYAKDLAALSPAALTCQRRMAARLGRLRDQVVEAYGRRCSVRETAGRECNRTARDRKVARVVASARQRIVGRCGAAFDALGLPALDDLLETVRARARYFALRVYPLLDLGPTELLGPHPVGVRTLELADASRLNVAGTGPRPVTVEVYYPSTPTAVAGVPRDIARLLGIDVFRTATYRDVAHAPGPLPLVLYSASSGGPRFENLILASHLASHGFVVVAVEHHGNGLLDTDADADTLLNRPLDMRFVIDRFLAFTADPDDFFAGTIDGARIGATGHSYGGYTTLALATGAFHLGTFTDPRVKGIVPLDGSVQVFFGEFPDIFSTISIPTLLLGGTRSILSTVLPATFDALTPGPTVTAYANLIDAGHLNFNDICEVPETLLGVVPECQPDFIPWRHAFHIVDYLVLNFFDAVLNGNADALARLAPARLASIEGLLYQSK